MKVITFKANEEFIKKLNEYASRKQMTRSEVIRRALEYYLGEEMKNNG